MFRYKQKRIKLYNALLLSGMLLLGITGCKPLPVQVSATGFYFDTFISVTIYDAENEERGNELSEGCMSLAEHYENLYSKSIPTSDISRINAHPGEYVTVDPDTITLLQTACEYASLSDGAIDPSIGAVSSLWDFHETTDPAIPPDDVLSEALTHVDYRKISIKDQQVMLTEKGMALDLGFIAKGYIADRIKEYLSGEGVKSAIISLGGNILALGEKPDGSPFHVGIQKPFADTGTALLTIEDSDRSVVSSGNYERYFEVDGVLYHHILSTENGYPVNSGLSQVTILSDDSVTGDALSTLCFILGYEKATTLLENYPDVQAIFVLDDGSVVSYNY